MRLAAEEVNIALCDYLVTVTAQVIAGFLQVAMP